MQSGSVQDARLCLSCGVLITLGLKQGWGKAEGPVRGCTEGQVRSCALFISGSQLHGVCMGRSWTSASAVYALSSHFCYVGGFGNLGDPVVPTPRGVSGDVVTVYAY